MKCPKCGFNSFDFLENCKKCGVELQDHKSRFGLRSLIFPGLPGKAPATASAPSPEQPTAETSTSADSTDFGFDFMNDEADGQQEPAADNGSDDFDFMSEESSDLAADEDEGFDFPADEPGSDDPTASLAADEDEAFALSEDDTEEPEAGDGDLDFDNWDDEEQEEDKKPAGAQEEPSDPFDLRESAAGKRAPGTDSIHDTPAAAGAVAADQRLEQAFVESGELFPLASATGSAGELPGATDPRFAPEHGAVDLTDDSEEITWADSDSGPDLDEDEPSTATGEVVLLPALGRRISASAVDILILAVVFLCFLVVGELTVGDGSGFWLPSLTTVIDQAVPYFLVLFALCFGYFTLFHFLTGQTPGKMLFDLRVESANGTPLQFSQAFLRSIGGLFAMLPCGFGYLSIVFNRQGRGWNDRFAGSRLVALLLPDDDGDGLLEP